MPLSLRRMYGALRSNEKKKLWDAETMLYRDFECTWNPVVQRLL